MINYNYFSKIITKKSKFCLRFLKRPPTKAAKWITWVGLTFLKNSKVLSRFLNLKFYKYSNHIKKITGVGYVRSTSLEDKNMNVSFSFLFSCSTTYLIAEPTRPVPPVTKTTLFSWMLIFVFRKKYFQNKINLKYFGTSI